MSDCNCEDIIIEISEEGQDGNGIVNIELLSDVLDVKTYRINFTNGSHFDYEVTDGSSIASIAKTGSILLTDTYTVTLTDGSTTTFQVTNGRGISSIEKSTTLGLTDSYRIRYNDGSTSSYQVVNGRGISSIALKSSDGLVDTYRITYNNGGRQDYTVTNGRGISNVEYVSSEGLVDTYRITFNDGTSTTFDITNGQPCTHSWNGTTLTVTSASGTSSANLKGENGDAATVTVGTTTTGAEGTDASVTNSGDSHAAKFDFVIPRGNTGNGIASIEKTGTSGLVDTYTITFTDASADPVTFTVTNATSGVWGSITGDIENQTDLQAEFADVNRDLSAYKKGDEYIHPTWESGGFDNSGAEVESDSYLRTDYIDIDDAYITKIITTASSLVNWYFYNSTQTYVAKGNATINGSQNVTYNASAKYVRFSIPVASQGKVDFTKNAKVVEVASELTAFESNHNDILSGKLEYVAKWENGILNSGAEEVNNLWKRTDYIPIADFNIVSMYQASAATFYIHQYDSSKSYLARITVNKAGEQLIAFNASTVYIRVTAQKTNDVRILSSGTFAEKTFQTATASASKSIIPNMSYECIHHDNFSRTMEDWEIGKNSENDLTDNSYDIITGTTDDRVRVDDGLTIAKDSSSSIPFTLRGIHAEHADNFMVEVNAPEVGEVIAIAYNVIDSLNFSLLQVIGNAAYYGVANQIVRNGSFVKNDSKSIYITGQYVCQFYFIGNVVSVYFDGRYAHEFVVDKVGNKVALCSYKAYKSVFKFINVFNLKDHLVWDSQYLTDDGVSTLPDSTLSAAENRYSLDSSITRFSNRSEKFALYSTDEYINNGRRTERSLVALLPGNLRTMRYEFDVYFPSTVGVDTDSSSYGDIFFQLHDRQAGVSRGTVPFALALRGNKIYLGQTASSAQASETLTQIFNGQVGEITTDKWMHFELFIKERYEENQHPFMELKIDGEVVYQSRKPNCPNDVKGSSAQYGEYKNNWDLITYSERYIDNFKVTY